MNSTAALLAMLALVLPGWSSVPRGGSPVEETVRVAPLRSEAEMPGSGFRSAPDPFIALQEAHRAPVARQVRIERRIIIRVAPSGSQLHQQMLADLPRRPVNRRYVEQPVEGCVPIEGIVGFQPAPENRLLLFMRDRRVLSAALERTCDAAAFYSGFYIERNADGAVCRRRDRLQSRAGASCQVTQFSRLVAAGD